MMEEGDAFRHILDECGAETQLIMLIEECGELIKAAAKYLNNREKTDVRLIEEMADTKLMIDQMVVAFECDELMKQIRHDKLERQLEKMHHGGRPEWQ